jgi:homoserine kinase
MHQVTVSVPATSANLGPGFDCLGIALTLYHRVTMKRAGDRELWITAAGEDAHLIPRDESNLVYQAARLVFQRLGLPAPGLSIHQENEIPVGSGLGSSSSAVLGGMFAANALVDWPLTAVDLLQMATDLEGHPDNVAPAVYGSLVLGIQGPEGLVTERFRLPPMRVTVVLPDFYLPTETARAALPAGIPFADAIYNSSRVALLIRALVEGDYGRLPLAMQDRLHQPYRIRLIPGMDAAFKAAYRAGASGVALSGAGPSLIAFAPSRHEEIAAAAAEAFAQEGLATRAWNLEIDAKGILCTT